MDSETNYTNIHDKEIIDDKKRGDILYYSVSQVASLLGEKDSTIRYYTNVFDSILKIEISDKELRYTNRDIDKLEFLINLKSKGMTVKEVKKYCEDLSLDIEDLIEVKENNSISAKEIISTIIESENKQISDLKEYLTNKINEINNFPTNDFLQTLEEKQNSQFNNLKEHILNEIKKSVDHKFDSDIKKYIDYKFDNEIKEYINHKLDSEFERNKNLHNEISLKIDKLITEKSSLDDTLKLQIDKLNKQVISKDDTLIDEFKKFKNIVEKAYFIQQEMDLHEQKPSLISRLFRIR